MQVSQKGKPRTKNNLQVVIDSFSGYNTLDEVVTELNEQGKQHSIDDRYYVNPSEFVAYISDNALDEGLHKWGDDFLNLLGEFKNYSEYSDFIKYNAYNRGKMSSNIYFDNVSKYMNIVESYLNDLHLKGLRVSTSSKYQYLTVHYDNFNDKIYELNSPEHLNNWNKVVDYISSMSCVSSIDPTYRYEGTQVWANVEFLCNCGDTVTHGPIPDFEEIPKKGDNSGVTYTVKVVTQPQYAFDQRSRFHQTANGELYVVHNYDYKCNDDSLDSFIKAVYSEKFAREHRFYDWKDYFSWLSSQDYRGNGALLDDAIVQITAAKAGRTRIIFKRDLPE